MQEISACSSLRPSRTWRRGLGLFGALVFFGSPLWASSQYSAPGILEPTEEIPEQEDLEESYEAARWPVGSLRFAPWLGVRNAGLVRGNPESALQEEDDFTITIGAGLRAYARTGKVFYALHMLPEYVWWEENEEKRQTNGRFGVGAFGYFNRVRWEASLRRTEEQGFFSSEVQELTTERRDEARLVAEVKVGSRLWVHGRARFQEFRNEEEEQTRLRQIARDEDSVRLGVRYRTPRGYFVGLGFEDLSTSFAEGLFDRSNSGEAGRFELGFEGNRLQYQLELADKSLDPDMGSGFRGFDDLTGELELLAQLSRRLVFLTWARRDIYYSIRAENSHFLSERFGARLELTGRRVRLGVFAEFGEDDYEAISGGGPDRLDDMTAYGASFAIDFGRTTGLVVDLLRTEYDSTLDTFDRDVTTLSARLEFGSLLRKLSIGNPPGAW